MTISEAGPSQPAFSAGFPLTDTGMSVSLHETMDDGGGIMGRSEARRRLPCIGVGLVALSFASGARAQYVESYFPSGIAAFDQQQGVTVLSRLRPLYDQPGVRLGAYTVNAHLDESVGYDSNLTGTSHGLSSAYISTSSNVSATSNWSRNRLGLSASVNNYTYINNPQQDYTAYSATVGGGYTIGRHDLNIGYTHLRQYERGTDVGSVASAAPVPFDVEDIRTEYTVEAGRFSFVPNVDIRLFQFGNAVVLEQPTSQQFRDRTVLSGGVTTRYELSGQRSVVVVLQGINSHYLRPQRGLTSNNSKSALLLAGIDYQASGLWRYRVLGGVEVRQFEASQYGTRAAPILEASVIYTPTGLTTVTGSARREIEDPQSDGVAGYTFTNVGLVVDHELQRNILLQGRANFQAAQFLQGNGTTTSYTLGAGVSWLVNRRVRLSADYDATQQSGSNNAVIAISQQGSTLGTTQTAQANAITTGNYSRNVVLLGFHLAL